MPPHFGESNTETDKHADHKFLWVPLLSPSFSPSSPELNMQPRLRNVNTEDPAQRWVSISLNAGTRAWPLRRKTQTSDVELHLHSTKASRELCLPVCFHPDEYLQAQSGRLSDFWLDDSLLARLVSLVFYSGLSLCFHSSFMALTPDVLIVRFRPERRHGWTPHFNMVRRSSSICTLLTHAKLSLS